MRIITTALALFLGAGAAIAADQTVNGYTKQNGTYVEPYHRSAPNSTTYDNYSTKGNVNPYTGAPGTRSPDYQRPAPTPGYSQPNPYTQPSPYGQPRPRNPYGTSP